MNSTLAKNMEKEGLDPEAPDKAWEKVKVREALTLRSFALARTDEGGLRDSGHKEPTSIAICDIII
jgi:hypothetical protein